MGDVREELASTLKAHGVFLHCVELGDGETAEYVRASDFVRVVNSLAARGAVPERMTAPKQEDYVTYQAWREAVSVQVGYNACRDAMLAAAPQPAGEAYTPKTALAAKLVSIRGASPAADRLPADELMSEPAPSAPAEMMRDAYVGAREDLLDWKRRAQRAEAELRRLGYAGIDASEPPTQPALTAQVKCEACDNPACWGCGEAIRPAPSAPSDVEALAANLELAAMAMRGLFDGRFACWHDNAHHCDEAAKLLRRRSRAQQADPESITGELVEIGDDDEGQSRLVIHTTRDAIKAVRSSLLFKPVVVQAAKDGES